MAESDSTAAFEILADGTRVAMLRALADRMRETPTEPWLGFSDLRERAGVRDSGNFSYHLDRLRGRFVRKTDEGYALTYAGIAVTSAIVAGTYDAGDPEEPVEIGDDCTFCDEPLRVGYADGMAYVACENGHHFANGFPPGAMEGRSMADAAALSSRLAQHDMELAVEGVCPMCYGSMEWSATAVADDRVGYTFDGTCERCGMRLYNTAGGCVVRHPAVVSFHDDHGIDIRERPYWRLDFCMAAPTVVTEEPLRLRIDIERDGDELRVTVDDEATVRAIERSPA